jgi:hypothetical protein
VITAILCLTFSSCPNLHISYAIYLINWLTYLSSTVKVNVGGSLRIVAASYQFMCCGYNYSNKSIFSYDRQYNVMLFDPIQSQNRNISS